MRIWGREDFLKDIRLRTCDVTEEKAEEALDVLAQVMREALIAGDSIKIPDFGVIYTIKPKGLKWVRSKRTGVRWQIPHKWEVRFRPSLNLKRALNPGVVMTTWGQYDYMKKKRLLRKLMHARSSSADEAGVQAEIAEHPADGGTPQSSGE